LSNTDKGAVGFILAQKLAILTTITIIQYVSPITTATRENFSSTCPLLTITTNLRGATPHDDRHPTAVGQHHAPPITREQSRGCKISSL